MSDAKHGYPWFLWPFAAVGNLLAFILKLTGRLVGALLGLTLMIAGVTLCFTIVGLPVGIPLALFGGALAVRSLF